MSTRIRACVPTISGNKERIQSVLYYITRLTDDKEHWVPLGSDLDNFRLLMGHPMYGTTTMIFLGWFLTYIMDQLVQCEVR